jgi:hypothetical protein
MDSPEKGQDLKKDIRKEKIDEEKLARQIVYELTSSGDLSSINSPEELDQIIIEKVRESLQGGY